MMAGRGHVELHSQLDLTQWSQRFPSSSPLVCRTLCTSVHGNNSYSHRASACEPVRACGK